jgi:Ran GTPase-activating protein (RanGAP) involved in mRNA processing and transport
LKNGTNTIPILLENVNKGEYSSFQNFLIVNEITVLDLSHGKLKNIDLMHLGQALQNTPVTKLILHNNDFTREDAEKLGIALKGTHINVLNVLHSKMDDDVATALVANLNGTEVTNLHLGNNRIGETGAARLGAYLDETKLIKLDLSLNDIKDSGLEKLGQMLKNNKTLKELNLICNGIGYVGLVNFIEALKDQRSNLQKVLLDDNNLSERDNNSKDRAGISFIY